MSVFNGEHLRNSQIGLDINGIRQGWYSDKYFANVAEILRQLHEHDYHFAGDRSRPNVPDGTFMTGDVHVEAQYFCRRQPFSLVAGVDLALMTLRYGTGFYEASRFVETWQNLEVEAVEDGMLVKYGGDPNHVQPVIKVRGRYRDFVLLETAMLGFMSRASRVATNVYRVLEVSNGKPILFFPARFDVPEVQAIDGYAYWLAVQRYNRDYDQSTPALASTDAQGAWWGGQGGGTVPHALIATFLGDTAESMVAYARYLPVSVPRIALVDFNNDCVGSSVAVLSAYWPHYLEALKAGDDEARKRWTLNGVRIDTSGNVRDVSLEPDGPYGINPQLVQNVRAGLDAAWEGWKVPEIYLDEAKAYCQAVQIVASGGFNRERIEAYEREGVPVDVYGVGSTFFQNDKTTNNDYSMDIVRVRLDNQWIEMAKVGRQPCHNPDLQPVDLREVE